MKINKNRVKVFFNYDQIDDKKLIDKITSLGFILGATGYNVKNGVREIEFDAPLKIIKDK